MQLPPNLKRRVVQPRGFCFTELSLSEAELSTFAVIASRAPAPTPAPLPPPPLLPPPLPRRPPSPSRRRPVHPAHALLAGGLAILSLPSCSELAAPALMEAGVEVVQRARAALMIQKRVLVAADRPEEEGRVEARSQGRPTRVAAPRGPVPPVVDTALLVRADLALSAGQYRTALAMYQKLIRRQPERVEALFGAALASHELKQARGSAAYLERTLALQPNHPLANVLAGFTEQLGQRYGHARARYSRFLSVEGSGPGADEIRAVLAGLPQADGSATAAGGR